MNYRPRNSSTNLTGWVNSDYLTGTEGLQLGASAGAQEVSDSKQADTIEEASSEQVVIESIAESAIAAPQANKPALTDSEAIADTQSVGGSPATPQPQVAPAAAEETATNNVADFIESVDAVCEPEPGSRHTDPDKRSCVGVSAANKD